MVIDSRRCPRCGRDDTQTEFYNTPRSRACKPCERARVRAWQLDHGEAWRDANRDALGRFRRRQNPLNPTPQPDNGDDGAPAPDIAPPSLLTDRDRADIAATPGPARAVAQQFHVTVADVLRIRRGAA